MADNNVNLYGVKRCCGTANMADQGPTVHLMQYRNGRVVRQGAGTSFFYYAPASTLVAIGLELEPAEDGLIESSLHTILKGRTALLIAHRPSTLLLADRVALLHEGRIVRQLFGVEHCAGGNAGVPSGIAQTSPVKRKAGRNSSKKARPPITYLSRYASICTRIFLQCASTIASYCSSDSVYARAGSSSKSMRAASGCARGSAKSDSPPASGSPRRRGGMPVSGRR